MGKMLSQLGRVAVLGACLLAAVASATAPKPHDVKRNVTVQGSFDDTWSALIDVFADRNWAIDKIDKASGFINTDWMNLGTEAKTYADCGDTSAFQNAQSTQVRFNVRVKDDNGASDVTVNATFRQLRSNLDDKSSGIDCISRGAVEQVIQSELAKRVHRKPATTPGDAGVDAE